VEKQGSSLSQMRSHLVFKDKGTDLCLLQLFSYRYYELL